MPEPLKERMSLALRDLLRQLEGDGGVTRWYTPTHVVRAESLEDDWLDSTIEGDRLILFIIPDDAQDEESTFTSTKTVQAFDIFAAKVYEPAVTNPLDEAYDTGEHPIRETVQNRIEADIKNQLRGDRTLEGPDGPLALHIQIPTTEKGPDTIEPGWAEVFLRVDVWCDHEDEAA